jgi:hypothetical protein
MTCPRFGNDARMRLAGLVVALLTPAYLLNLAARFPSP